MQVIFTQSLCESFDQETRVFCLFGTNFTTLEQKSSIYAPVYQQYMTELLSVLKFHQDHSYFSFTHLFNSQIWVLLLFSLIAYTFILSKFHNPPFSIHLFLELGDYFVGQSSNLIDKLGRTNKLLASTVVIWYLSTTIVRMCFTSLLLGVYFRRKPYLTAETLEDLVEQPGLRIGGYFSLKEIKSLMPDIFAKLEPRVFQYDDMLNYEMNIARPSQYLLDDKLVRDIVNRKAVFLLNSYFGGVFKKLYPGADLMLSDHKCAQQYSYFYATKNIFKRSEDREMFQRMMKTIFETGWTNRLFMLYEIVADVYATTNPEWIDKLSTIIPEDNQEHQLKLSVVFSNTITCLLLGVIISTIILICELSQSVSVTS